VLLRISASGFILWTQEIREGKAAQAKQPLPHSSIDDTIVEVGAVEKTHLSAKELRVECMFPTHIEGK